MRRKKISWAELERIMTAHTSKVSYCNDQNPVKAVVVFDPERSKWQHRNNGYSLKARSYEMSSCSKYWHGECGGNSLFALCLDEKEYDSIGIRLDWYLGEWVVDYCYITDNGKVA